MEPDHFLGQLLSELSVVVKLPPALILWGHVQQKKMKIYFWKETMMRDSIRYIFKEWQKEQAYCTADSPQWPKSAV